MYVFADSFRAYDTIQAVVSFAVPFHHIRLTTDGRNYAYIFDTCVAVETFESEISL